MSYLTVTNDCSCANYQVPLRAINEIRIPKSKKHLSNVSALSNGEYVITVDYLEDDQYTMRFCDKCWEDVECVIDQLKRVVKHTLFKETA